jgi:hypothetical protein
MNFVVKSQLIFIFIFYSCTIVKASWVTSCKPCVNVLESCIKCSTKTECEDCARSYKNNECYKCYADIFVEPLNCENSIKYQNLACTVKCQVEDSLKGTCNPKSGACTCGSDDFIAQLLNSQMVLLIPTNGSFNSTFKLKVDFNLIFSLIVFVKIILI